MVTHLPFWIWLTRDFWLPRCCVAVNLYSGLPNMSRENGALSSALTKLSVVRFGPARLAVW